MCQILSRSRKSACQLFYLSAYEIAMSKAITLLEESFHLFDRFPGCESAANGCHAMTGESSPVLLSTILLSSALTIHALKNVNIRVIEIPAIKNWSRTP